MNLRPYQKEAIENLKNMKTAVLELPSTHHDESTCKHCGVAIRRVGGLWFDDKAELAQYCYVDVSNGSRLHEPCEQKDDSSMKALYFVFLEGRDDPASPYIFDDFEFVKDSVAMTYSKVPHSFKPAVMRNGRRQWEVRRLEGALRVEGPLELRVEEVTISSIEKRPTHF